MPKETEKKSAFSSLTKVHPAYKDREYFAENLALLLKSAVPIGEALGSIASGMKTRAMKSLIAQMQEDIDAGYSLSGALERSGIVSGQTLALARLGEASGHLVENMQLAAKQEEKQHIFQARIRSALMYPVFVLGLTLVVGLAVAWFLLPRLSQTFSQLDVTLPTISKIMLGFGTFLREHGMVAIPGLLVVLSLLVYIFFFAPQTKYLGKRFLFKVPGVGRLLREVEVAQFGYLLGTLLDAGLPVRQTMDLMSRATSSSDYAALYRYLGESLEDGLSFKEALSKYKNSDKLLPPSVQQMIFAGERSGALPEVMLTIGRNYEEKSDITTQNLESIIEPVLLLVVAAGVLLVAVAVIVPVYSLIGGLNQ